MLYHLQHPLRRTPSSIPIVFRYVQYRHFRLVAFSDPSVEEPPCHPDETDACNVEALPMPAPAVLVAIPWPGYEPPVLVTAVSSTATEPTLAASTAEERPKGSVASNGSTDTPTGGPAVSESTSSPSFAWSLRPGAIDALRTRVSDGYRGLSAAYRAHAEKRCREFAVNTAATLTLLSMKVNEVTGYREVQRLKDAVKERELDLTARRAEAKGTKTEYEAAVATRSSSQQNVNSLLERKHTWTDADVAEFTKLVRSDHASRHAVTTTAQDMKAAEVAADRAFSALMQAILERYHEEQVWSDKIRSVSTWANIIALAANLIVFVGAIAFVEPWKRRRLVQGLEERMTGMMNRVDEELKMLSANVAKLEPPIAAVAAATTAGVPTGTALATGAGALGVPAPEADALVPATEPSAEPVESAAVPPVQPGTVPSSPASVPDSDTFSTLAAPSETRGNDTLSPIEQLAARATPDSHQSVALGWMTTQLAQVAPPSAERDLATAGAIGAVGGAVAVGLITVIIRGLRG